MNADKWLDEARRINAALTLKGGIEMGDAGFDRMLTLSDQGLKMLAKSLQRVAREAVEDAAMREANASEASE